MVTGSKRTVTIDRRIREQGTRWLRDALLGQVIFFVRGICYGCALGTCTSVSQCLCKIRAYSPVEGDPGRSTFRFIIYILHPRAVAYSNGEKTRFFAIKCVMQLTLRQEFLLFKQI